MSRMIQKSGVESPQENRIEEIQSNIENLVFEHVFLCNKKKCEGDMSVAFSQQVSWVVVSLMRIWGHLLLTASISTFLYERKHWELRKTILKIFTISGTLGEGERKTIQNWEICITYNTVLWILFPLFGHLGYSLFSEI